MALYEDTAVLYWKIYSDKFTLPIENFSCTITLPDGTALSESDLVWLHCEVAGSAVHKTADSFEYTVEDVAAGNYIETRILTDKALFDSAEVVSIPQKSQNKTEKRSAKILLPKNRNGTTSGARK